MHTIAKTIIIALFFFPIIISISSTKANKSHMFSIKNSANSVIIEILNIGISKAKIKATTKTVTRKVSLALRENCLMYENAKKQTMIHKNIH